MTNEKETPPGIQGESFLQELKAFLGFLNSLWGLLAGISILFPLSNAFIKVIPLKEAVPFQGTGLVYNGNGLLNLTPQLITTITTLVLLFLVLWEFGKRFEFIKNGKLNGRNDFMNDALIHLIYGFIMLAIYLAIYYLKEASFIGDFFLAIMYTAFFYFITYAFMKLAMVEYFGIGKNEN